MLVFAFARRYYPIFYTKNNYVEKALFNIVFQLYCWKIDVKFNTFHISQTIHLNFYVNLT